VVGYARTAIGQCCQKDRIDSCVRYRYELPIEWGMVLEQRPTEWR